MLHSPSLTNLTDNLENMDYDINGPATLMAVCGTRDTEIMTRIRSLESKIEQLEWIIDRLMDRSS